MDIAFGQYHIQGAQVGAMIDDGTNGCRLVGRLPGQVAN